MSNRSYDKKILTTFVSHNLDFIYLVIPIFFTTGTFFYLAPFSLYLFIYFYLSYSILTSLQHSPYSLKDQLWHTAALLFCMQYVVGLIYWQR